MQVTINLPPSPHARASGACSWAMREGSCGESSSSSAHELAGCRRAAAAISPLAGHHDTALHSNPAPNPITHSSVGPPICFVGQISCDLGSSRLQNHN